MKTRTNQRKGFTLIEILAVVTIILILAGIILPAINKAINRADSARARSAVNQLGTAFNSYFTEIGRWPTNVSGVNSIDFMIKTNLFGNAANIVFYDVAPKDVGSTNSGMAATLQNAIIDPWRNPYYCRLDVGYTGAVNDPVTGASVSGRGVLIWSLGPDGLSNTVDDIKNW